MGKKKDKVKEAEIEFLTPSSDVPRDLVNDPMFLRDLIHRIMDILPDELSGSVLEEGVTREQVDEVVNDVGFLFAAEEELGYPIPSAGDEDDEDEEEEGEEAEDDEDEDDD